LGAPACAKQTGGAAERAARHHGDQPWQTDWLAPFRLFRAIAPVLVPNAGTPRPAVFPDVEMLNNDRLHRLKNCFSEIRIYTVIRNNRSASARLILVLR